jgi:hypothetical protein
MEISAGKGRLIAGYIVRESDGVDGLLIRTAISEVDKPVPIGEVVEFRESDVVIWFETRKSITELRQLLEAIERVS